MDMIINQSSREKIYEENKVYIYLFKIIYLYHIKIILIKNYINFKKCVFLIFKIVFIYFNL